MLYYFRDSLKKWFYQRKIKPTYDRVMDTFEEKVLPGYVETRPKLMVQLRKEDLPKESPFGYILVPPEDAEKVMPFLVSYVPLNSSLRIIRTLFEEKMRLALFDYLSYKLGIKINCPEIAVKFRDRALRDYPEEYKTIEKLDSDEKLTGIILEEAFMRIKKCHGQPSTSDVEEFSLLVKKIAEIDIAVVRIGDLSSQSYVKKILEMEKSVVLLARGLYVNKAIEVASRLLEKDYEYFSSEELGLQNPELGIWHFRHPPPEHDVPLIRIWLKRK